MLSKTAVLKSIGELPEHFQADDAIEKIILLNKIENARQQRRNGEGYTIEESKEKLSKWLKSS